MWFDLTTKFVIYPILAYLVSILIKGFLDRNVSNFRLDKRLLFIFFVKNVAVGLKVKIHSEDPLNLEQIKKKITKEFSGNFETNEIYKKPETYEIKFRDCFVALKIRKFDKEDEEDKYTLTIETSSDDQLSKFNYSTPTFEKIEKICYLLGKEKSENQVNVSVKFKFWKYTDSKENVVINNGNITYQSNSINYKLETFSNISEKIKKIIIEWSIKYL